MKKFLLAIVALSAASFAHAQCTDLFISEYVEGSSHSKALEIYNPTSSTIALSNYRLIRFSNGSSLPVDSFDLTGSLPAHSVWVVTNGQATPDQNQAYCDSALMAMADQLAPAPYVAGTAVLFMNGDDAIALVKINPHVYLDIFGKIGEDPGTAWTDQFPYTSAAGTWWTVDHTLIRKASVQGGVTANPTAFNVTTEWDSLPENTWTNLGMHTCVCGNTGILDGTTNASFSVYPNPSNGTFTIMASSAINTIEIYNVLGERVYTETTAAVDNKQVNLSGKPSGIYLVNVLLANGKRSVSRISVQ
jgi:predicted extracellular nuclease